MTPSSVVAGYQCLRGPCCHHLYDKLTKIWESESLQLTVSQSLSPSFRRTSSGNNDQVLVVVKTGDVLFLWGVLPVENIGLSCNSSVFVFLCQAKYNYVGIFRFIFIFLTSFLVFLNSMSMYKPGLSVQKMYRSCLILTYFFNWLLLSLSDLGLP
jgi:hypothetical protein